MKYRRYYSRGSNHKYVNSEEQFEKMVGVYGFEAAVELDNANIEIVPETNEEHIKLFNDSCERVMNNTRFYLDNLDKVATFVINIKKIHPKSKHL